MPFDQSLEKMVSLLRPGGVLAVLGLFREASLTDRGVALIAVPVNVFYALSRGSSSSGVPAPTKPADMSLREIRESVSSNLPNARLQRLLLWRYLLTWQLLPGTTDEEIHSTEAVIGVEFPEDIKASYRIH